MQGRVEYQNEVTDGPSPAIWADPDLIRTKDDPRLSYLIWDDFTKFGQVAASQDNILVGGYKAFTSAGCTISDAGSGGAGGIVTLSTDTDTDAAVIASCVYPFNITGLASTGKKLAFEARIQTAAVTNAYNELFVGLLQQCTLAADVPITNTATTLSNICVGFHRTESDGDAINLSYFDAATVAIKTAAITNAAQTASAGGTIPAFVLATWIKLGMKYDPTTVDANGHNLSFYADGVLLDDGLTNAEIAALTNVDVTTLGLCFAIRAAATATNTASISWWRAQQLY